MYAQEPGMGVEHPTSGDITRNSPFFCRQKICENSIMRVLDEFFDDKKV
jgi:hypothetical protein